MRTSASLNERTADAAGGPAHPRTSMNDEQSAYL